MLSSDFFRGTVGFFRWYARLLPKKSFFAPNARKDFFRDTDGFWDVFRESDGFFRGRNWQFWWIHAHSFPSERWKSHEICDFHRLLGKESLSIACSEKVRGEGQPL